MKKFILILSLTVLVSCVPARITRMPEVNVLVQNVEGEPIEGASVNLIVRGYPYGRYVDHISYITGENGLVTFNKKGEWVTQLLVMHGMTSYFWDLCVKNAGYAAGLLKDVTSDVNVVLNKGSNSNCYDSSMLKKEYLNWPPAL